MINLDSAEQVLREALAMEPVDGKARFSAAALGLTLIDELRQTRLKLSALEDEISGMVDQHRLIKAESRGWERAKREIKGIPHWYNEERGYGEFDLQPLGLDETSESGAFMAVMAVLDDNPYRTDDHA